MDFEVTEQALREEFFRKTHLDFRVSGFTLTQY